MKSQSSGVYSSPDLFSSMEDNINPFHNRRVVIGGEFSLSTKALRSRLRAMGADIENNVTKNTHYVVLGASVPETLKENLYNVKVRRGYDVMELSENDLTAILNGRFEGYYTDKEVRKNLMLTYSHYSEAYIKPMEGENPVLEENIYIPSNVEVRRDVLCQIIGNIGAYANDEITNGSDADKTKPIVMLTDATLERLKNGEKDDVIAYIERIYNESNSDGLPYQFISMSELLAWTKKRSKDSGDEYTLSLLDFI